MFEALMPTELNAIERKVERAEADPTDCAYVVLGAREARTLLDMAGRSEEFDTVKQELEDAEANILDLEEERDEAKEEASATQKENDELTKENEKLQMQLDELRGDQAA